MTDIQTSIADVREQIAAVLLEIDEIALQINPQILSEYALKIGCLENELLRAQMEARRAKRRCALAQARANAGERVDEGDIELQLDAELALWEEQLQERIDAYLQDLERNAGSRILMPHEAHELKALHRALVMRLHPDLNPMQSEEEQRLFHIMQNAFKNGDLATLRAVDTSTKHLDRTKPPARTEDELHAEFEVLCAQLAITEERLATLKAEPPYTLRTKLADAKWVLETTENLNVQIEEQREAVTAYNERYNALKGGVR